MPSINASFTAPGISSTLISIAHSDSSFTLTGDFIGTAVVERSITTSGLAWEVVAGPLYAAGSVGFTSEDGGRYRLRCLTYASGTANCTLALADTPPVTFDFDFNHITSVSGALNGTLGATTPNTAAVTTLTSTGGALNGTLGLAAPKNAVFNGSPLAGSAYHSVQISGNYVGLTGSSIKQNLSAQVGQVTGALSNGSYVYHLIQTQNDNLGLGSVGTPEAINLGIYHTFGGTGVTGARTPLRVAMTMNADTNNTIDSFHRAISIGATSAFKDGGTALLSKGKWFGSIIDVGLISGANYYTSIQGSEIDVTTEAGVSVKYKGGLSIVRKSNDGSRGVIADAALFFADQPGSAVGWLNGLAFGNPNGVWAFRSDSTLIGTNSTTLGGSAYVADIGMDFSAVTFTTASIKLPGFSIGPLGKPSSTGLSSSTTYANDAAAAAGGVAVGGFYRNGSVVQIRVT